MENKIAFKCSFESSELKKCVESLGWMKSRCVVPVTVFSALVKTIYHFAVGVFTLLRDLVIFRTVSPALRWTVFTCRRDLGEAWGYFTLWVPFYKDEDSYEKIAFSLLHKNYYTEAYRNILSASSGICQSVISEIENGRKIVKDLVSACDLYLKQIKSGIFLMKGEDLLSTDLWRLQNTLEDCLEKLKEHSDEYDKMTKTMISERKRSLFGGTVSTEVTLTRFNKALNGLGNCAHEFRISHIELENLCSTSTTNISEDFEGITVEMVQSFSNYKDVSNNVSKFLNKFHCKFS